jgi:hypothetical protein
LRLALAALIDYYQRIAVNNTRFANHLIATGATDRE